MASVAQHQLCPVEHPLYLDQKGLLKNARKVYATPMLTLDLIYMSTERNTTPDQTRFAAQPPPVIFRDPLISVIDPGRSKKRLERRRCSCEPDLCEAW